jgi:hypothetical protein
MRLDFNAYFYKTQLHQVNCAVNSLKTNTIKCKNPQYPHSSLTGTNPEIYVQRRCLFSGKRCFKNLP